MRQRPVVVIAVSLLLIAGATGFQLRGQVLHLLDVNGVIPGSAPLPSGSLWICPSGWLNAYQSSMLFYPYNHPALPPLATKPTRCYRTDGEAKSAGYKLAPPPMGGVVLDGVYLVPSSNEVRTNCDAAAAQLHIAIPCPTLLPLEVADSFCPQIPGCTRDGYFEAVIALRTPLDFPGASAPPSAFPERRELVLTLWAAPLSSTFGQQMNECPRGNFGPTVMKRPTLWITCATPAGEFPGWLTWEIDDWIYQFGADAPPTSAIRRIIQFVAAKLVPVSATSSAAGASPPPRQIGAPAVPIPAALPLPAASAVAPGTYFLANPCVDDKGNEVGACSGYRRIYLALPVGWATSNGLLYKHLGQPGEVALSAWTVRDVYDDPCHWQGSALSQLDIGHSSYDAATGRLTVAPYDGGLANQALRGPVPRALTQSTMAGVDGSGASWPPIALRIDLSVPADLDMSTCDKGEFRSWPRPYIGPTEPTTAAAASLADGANSHHAPGQLDTVYMVDVDQFPLVIDASHMPATSEADLAELKAILASLVIVR